MNNLRQINTISYALCLQEQRFRSELVKTNMQIEKRMLAIQKIIAYQREYIDSNKYRLSHAVPLLEKNLYAFSQKISLLIVFEEKEIFKLNRIRKNLIDKIDDIEKKIKLMAMFKRRITDVKNQQDELREQHQADDLSTLKSSEHDNE
jgi:hypothetical protein